MNDNGKRINVKGEQGAWRWCPRGADTWRRAGFFLSHLKTISKADITSQCSKQDRMD